MASLPGLLTASCLGYALAAAVPGHFVTTETATKAFDWSERKHTAEEALNLTFPGRAGWVDLSYSDGNGSTVTWESLAAWIDDELLSGTGPFESHPERVPVPWPEENGLSDQLGAGQWVAYTRRQVCYITAQTMLGANTTDYRNGLSRFLDNSPGWSDCTPRTGDFGKSLFALLAACSVDPGLAGGAQGPTLLVAKAGEPKEMPVLHNASKEVNLTGAGLRVCRYDDGLASAALPGLPPVPPEGCQQPSAEGPGRDFMTGGSEHITGQAIQDISAAFIGGYIYGNVCGLGGGQDERLLVYMPEVTVLTFFLSQAAERPQLRVPAWVLGARMFFKGLDGTGRFDQKLEHDSDVPLQRDLLYVQLGGETVTMSSSRPFVAFMSESQGFLGEPEEDFGPDVRAARRNKHPLQRDVNASSNFSFAMQVRAWYTGVALTSYHPDVRAALRQVVRSIGTGPWLAGLWWGDSQLGLVASWLGHALAAPTWGASALPLDYYLYSAFTESPGNQCFVHSEKNCRSCLQHCLSKPLPDSAYWLPDWAYMRNGSAKACAGFQDDCGEKGLEHILETFGNASAGSLWQAVEGVLRESPGDVSRSVFDLLLQPGEGEAEETQSVMSGAAGCTFGLVATMLAATSSFVPGLLC